MQKLLDDSAVDSPMEVVELQPLIWATLARSQSVCPWEPYGRGSSGHIRGGMASNPQLHEDTKEPKTSVLRKEKKAQMDAAGRSRGCRRSPA